jgi:hypothetical protein
LTGGGDHPWSFDLVSVAASGILVVGFACALAAQWISERDHPGMDTRTKREIWLLAIGTILAEMPIVAIAAFAILSH